MGSVTSWGPLPPDVRWSSLRPHVSSTDVPGGLPVVPPVSHTVQDLGDEYQYKTFFWIKVGPLRASLCAWVDHLGRTLCTSSHVKNIE